MSRFSRFFEECGYHDHCCEDYPEGKNTGMTMRHAGHNIRNHSWDSVEAFAANTYLGYAACCEGDYSLDSDILDDVVRAALASSYDEISIEEACLAAGVDFDSLDHGDIQYILKQFASEKGGF